MNSTLLTALIPALTLLLALTSYVTSKRPPNIVIMMVDDVGWGDFQSHDPMMVTPNIRKLREEGMFLNQSYVLPMCVPTRAALLTGRYPHTYGLQCGRVLRSQSNFYLNENLTTMAQEMKSLGYQTHMVGKWHLGLCHPGLLPHGRGFDSFYGMLLGGHKTNYYHNKTAKYDMRDGDNIDWSARGTYKTDVFHKAAMRVLEDKINYTKPFFFYMAYYAAHSPYEVPQRYRDRFCSHVTNESRQIYCAMLARADESIGQLLQVLKDKGVYNNTIVLFLSDNGSPAQNGYSSNWPLRGAKQTVYEGGTRSYTILKAPRLAATNVTWPHMMHVIDWLPTLVTAAGGSAPSYAHGLNMWPQLRKNRKGRRKEFIYTVNDYHKVNHSAFRYKKWKLIKGRAGSTIKLGWYPPFQLLGSVPWGLDGAEVEENYALYNLEKDPEERKNLYNDTRTARIKEIFRKKIEDYLGVPGVKEGKYPTQPSVDSERLPNVKDLTDENGALVTNCACMPAGVADKFTCP